MKVTVRTHYNVDSPKDKLAILGDCAPLGCWNPDLAVVGIEHPIKTGNWLMTFERDPEPEQVYFKMVVIRGDWGHRQVVRWEECGDRLMPLLENIHCPWNGRAVFDSEAWQFNQSDIVSNVKRTLADEAYTPRTPCDAANCQIRNSRAGNRVEDVTSQYIDRHAKDTVGMYQTRRKVSCKQNTVGNLFPTTQYITHPLELLKPTPEDIDSDSSSYGAGSNSQFAHVTQQNIETATERNKDSTSSTMTTEEEERWGRVEEVLATMQGAGNLRPGDDRTLPDYGAEGQTRSNTDSQTVSSVSLTRDAENDADLDSFLQFQSESESPTILEPPWTLPDASLKPVDPEHHSDVSPMTSELIAATKKIVETVLPDITSITEPKGSRSAKSSPTGISSKGTDAKFGVTRNVKSRHVSQTISCGTWKDCCLLEGCSGGPRQRRAVANTWMHLHDLLVTDPDDHLERIE